MGKLKNGDRIVHKADCGFYVVDVAYRGDGQPFAVVQYIGDGGLYYSAHRSLHIAKAVAQALASCLSL